MQQQTRPCLRSPIKHQGQTTSEYTSTCIGSLPSCRSLYQLAPRDLESTTSQVARNAFTGRMPGAGPGLPGIPESRASSVPRPDRPPRSPENRGSHPARRHNGAGLISGTITGHLSIY
jgi:hypothetical protein